MKLIVGLGNPEGKYEGTRHNIGFDVIDSLSKKNSISVSAFEKHGLIGKGIINGAKVMLVKPQTYMNLSGVCLRALADYYDIDASDILVIYDDIDLEPGKIRIRKKGSAGGHNGIKSIIKELGTQEFDRIKVGVGKKPPEWDLADWVLSRFDKDSRTLVDKASEEVCDAVSCIIQEGTEVAMNRFN